MKIAEFIIDEENEMVKLITDCISCKKDINIIYFLLYHIPDIVKHLPNKLTPSTKLKLFVKCPSCGYRFQIDYLKYFGD